MEQFYLLILAEQFKNGIYKHGSINFKMSYSTSNYYKNIFSEVRNTSQKRQFVRKFLSSDTQSKSSQRIRRLLLFLGNVDHVLTWHVKHDMHLAILFPNERDGVESMSVIQTMPEDTNALPGRVERTLQSFVRILKTLFALNFY